MMTSVEAWLLAAGQFGHFWTWLWDQSVISWAWLGDAGNFGNFGMQKFQTGHVCGKYCKSIGNTNFAATNAVTREQQEREENEAQKRELKKLEHVGGILAFACLVYSIELLLATYLPNWNFVDTLARAVVYLIAGGGMFMFIERRVLKRKVA